MRTVISGGQQHVLVLSDGALAVVTRSSSWQQAGVYISYDWGKSWSYTIGGPYSTQGAVRVGKDRLLVFTNEGQDTALYRWVQNPRN